MASTANLADNNCLAQQNNNCLIGTINSASPATRTLQGMQQPLHNNNNTTHPLLMAGKLDLLLLTACRPGYKVARFWREKVGQQNMDILEGTAW